MKSAEYKLKVLSKIADRLNEAKITWAVGASLLLYFNGITDEFHDIDIMVTESDVFRLKEILQSFGSMNPPNPDGKYKTRHFMEFVVDEVDIDVMAGFVIVDHDKEYDCSLQEEQIVEHKMVNGVNIPLQSVALWRDYYKWMHRDKKVAMIDQGYDAVLHSFSKKVQKQILEEENIQNEPEIWDLYSEDRKLLGRDHVRGEQLPAGCYHLVVHVWIRNSKGEYLISQRAASRPTNPLMWECVGGSVIKGEDSLQGAIREAKEEVGVDLLPENGRVLFTKTRKTEGERRFNDIMDVWLFIYDGEVDLKNATTDEVAQVTWMNRGQIMELFQENAFVETLNYFFTEVEKVPDIQAQK